MFLAWKEIKYNKEVIMNSKFAYNFNIDVLEIILKDNQEYSKKEIQQLYTEFMKGECK